MGWSHGERWDKEKIKQGIEKVITILQLNRFPSSSEIKGVNKSGALHNAIVRNGGYKYWAELFGLEFKDSETKLGKNFEDYATKQIKELFGFDVKQMSMKHPYDLLVEGQVKIDVKVAFPTIINGGRVHAFCLHKEFATCDLYIIFALDESGQVERQFIIPSHELKILNLCVGKTSKYNKYIDKWDYIEKYNKFYAEVS